LELVVQFSQENTGMRIDFNDFRSSKGTAVWPEKELKDLVCDVKRVVVQQYWECVI
jgi:hypothetical protein